MVEKTECYTESIRMTRIEKLNKVQLSGHYRFLKWMLSVQSPLICLYSRSLPMTKSCASLVKVGMTEVRRHRCVVLCDGRGRPRPRSRGRRRSTDDIHCSYTDRLFPSRYVRHLSCSGSSQTGSQATLPSASMSVDVLRLPELLVAQK